MGIGFVPQVQNVFPNLTVEQNLHIAGSKSDSSFLEEAFALFPLLRERQDQLAGDMSGGEQQMLAVARALMARPKLLLMDEPSLGLAPLIVEEIFRIIRDLNAEGTSIFLVEQNVHQALKVAHHFYLLEQGRVTFGGSPGDLEEDEVIQRAYLGSAETT